jgi:hypothetical protein
MKLLLWAMVGGALGSGERRTVSVGFGRWLGAGFPCWTLFVNVAGCLLSSVSVEMLALRLKASRELRTFIATDILRASRRSRHTRSISPPWLDDSNNWRPTPPSLARSSCQLPGSVAGCGLGGGC